jgi:DNA polymerase III subunit delta'
LYNFDGIFERDKLKEALKSAIDMGKISQAYLFYGPEGIGKKFIADVFAAALECGEKDAPCGRCLSCRKAEDGIHPDIIRLKHEKPDLISVDEVREQIVADAYVKPFESKYKIYIVDEADKMNEQAQNAILKTIEEPPSFDVFIFIAENIQLFLPTVISRVRVFEVPPVSKELIEKQLLQEYPISRERAESLAALSQGCMGKAIRYASSEEFNEQYNSIFSYISKRDVTKFSDLYSKIKEICADKTMAGLTMDIFMMWYRDLMAYKISNDNNILYFKENIDDIRRQSQKYTFRELNAFNEKIGVVKRMIAANVKAENAAELLL